MTDEKKRDAEEDFGFEIENDADTQENAPEDEGLSREEAANLLKNFNAIFDEDDS
jgi:hypothetical protein